LLWQRPYEPSTASYTALIAKSHKLERHSMFDAAAANAEQQEASSELAESETEPAMLRLGSKKQACIPGTACQCVARRRPSLPHVHAPWRPWQRHATDTCHSTCNEHLSCRHDRAAVRTLALCATLTGDSADDPILERHEGVAQVAPVTGYVYSRFSTVIRILGTLVRILGTFIRVSVP
jgi:hypothetical protein